VIYQTDPERASLPQGLQWRHVRYEPPNIDFTWEREWRICTDILPLEPQATLVVVRTVREAHRINYEFSQLSHAGTPANPTIASNPTWMAVSLDLYGL
jgi:hypothetical protein